MQISKSVSLKDSQIVEITARQYSYYNLDAKTTKEINPQVVSFSIEQIVQELLERSLSPL